MIIEVPTPAQLEQLRIDGQFWWYRPSTGTYYATTQNAPELPDDAFCLEASDSWVAQWPDEGWGESAYAQLAPLIARYNETEG